MPTKHSKNLKNNAANSLKRGKIQTPTWIDPKTNLEWQYESAGEMSWNEALEYAQSLSLNDKDDWRLPTVLELDTLLDAYYRARGWNENGIPTKETLQRVGLGDIAEKMGLGNNDKVDR